MASAAATDDFGGPNSGGAAEHDQVEQRVGAQAVGAVDRHAGRFADRHQAGDDLIGIFRGRTDDFAAVVGRNAAHVVVDGRQDRDRLLGDVDIREDLGRLGDAGQAFVD